MSVNKFVFNSYNIINAVCLNLISSCILSVSFRLLFFYSFILLMFLCCRSQWPRGLRRGSSVARLLRLWVRIQPDFRIWPPQRQNAIVWMIAHLVTYHIQGQRCKSLMDYMDYMRTARWKADPRTT
jgi:hypothetical protein